MPYDPDTALDRAHDEVRAEIARVDNKVGLLLAFNGAVLLAVGALAKDLHDIALAAQITGSLGIVTLGGSITLLLHAVRPRLGGNAPAGFPLWATQTSFEIRRELATDSRADDIATLSRIALAKYRKLQRAVDLTRAGNLTILLAAALATI
ncbi:Pycsar system effector family protein [Streptomyces jumonjinensis]|uniref:Integral membrane plasmid transfer protein n=1 Tax=Streptomyces jumonjinensis TaxID=1945 RepID=A0A646KM39_STRJU|nr:Pycsar system effector family protein [Streptomyces jumonjinensis]MQT03150.1 integral membrane plasmid transfer protein [Streptomyces jumonjinensis]